MSGCIFPPCNSVVFPKLPICQGRKTFQTNNEYLAPWVQLQVFNIRGFRGVENETCVFFLGVSESNDDSHWWSYTVNVKTPSVKKSFSKGENIWGLAKNENGGSRLD